MASTSSVSSSSTTTYSTDAFDFDTDAIVEAAVAARTDRADEIDTKISANETKISAYEQTQTLLQDLEDSIDALNDPSNEDNVFEERIGTLTSSTSTDATELLDTTIESGTATGSHTVEITQVATAQRLGSTYQSSRSEELGLTGTLSISTDTGSADISITDDMSLEEIADAINLMNDDTGVTASILTVSSGEYMLVLTADNTNQEISVTSDSSTDMAQSLGITDSSGDYTKVLQEAQPAIITVDGISGIERDSNDIDDVIDGITLHLLKAESGTTITIKVEQDTDAIEEALNDFVTAYNSWRSWVAQNQATNSDGTASDTAYLFGDSTLRSASTSLASILGNMVDGHSLAEFGITLNEDNELEIDDDTLEDALDNNLSELQALLEYSGKTSSTELTLDSHNEATYSGSFQMKISVDADGDLSGVSVNGDSSLFTVSGNTITGAEGSIYEGLVFKYTGDTAATVTVTISQGLADQMYQVTHGASDSDTGTLQTLIDDLESTDDDLQDQSDQIRSDAEEYRDYLLTYYAKIEAKIAAAESTLTVLKALNDSDSSDS